MTVMIYDGENLLMDRISAMDFTNNNSWDLMPDKDGEIKSYFEKHSKIRIIEDSSKAAKCWGKDVKAWTTVGVDNLGFKHYMSAESGDLRQLTTMAKCFPGIVTLGTQFLAIDSDRNLTHIYYDPNTGSAVAEEYECVRDNCVVVGYGSEHFKGWENLTFAGSDRYATALEVLVMMQGAYPILGRRFDHYHIPTHTLKTGLDLSDRQRRMIMAKLIADSSFKVIPSPVHISNLGD